MRRVALAIISTVTGLVILLSFKTHSTISTPAAAIGTATPGSDASTAPSGGSSSTSSSASSTKSSSMAVSKTVTGDAADTQYGPVQVQITVKNGTITAVTVTEYPSNDPRDQEINSYAIPQLNQEAMSAQSAQIDAISGATYTSEGYITSLQSALDKAGL